ncbi:MAG: DUF4363 family protein [Clostridia bacterium]|nr:DUF4363 family protein [Clostridia bacterium]
MENSKKMFLIFFILIIVILLDLFLFFKTNKLMEDIINDLGKLENRILEKNEKEINKMAKELKNNWEKTENKLSFFVEHEVAEKVSLKITTIVENVKNEENQNALEDIAETKLLLKHIERKYNLTFKNVF